jgi:hypothetical protein
MLPADKNENSCGQRQDAHNQTRDDNGVNQQTESGQNEINREQQHADIFGKVHGASILIVPSRDNANPHGT